MGKQQLDFAPRPVPPKKALSPFFLYRGQVYEEVRKKNPEAKITQVTKIISTMWNSADEKIKARLEAEYEKNKEIAQREREQYEEKYGKIERRRRRVIKRH